MEGRKEGRKREREGGKEEKKEHAIKTIGALQSLRYLLPGYLRRKFADLCFKETLTYS